MGASKLLKSRNRRSRTESENSGRWENDDQGIQMKGEKAPLSPVSEAQDEDDDDGLYMYDIRDAGVPAVPDGGYGWVIVFASFMCNLIVDGIAYTFGVFLPKIAESLGQGKGQVAWAGSLLCGVYLCVGPIVSALANKYGCRSVCIAGSFVGSAGFALSYLSPDLSILMLTYGVVGGVGFGLIYLPAVVCVGYYFESKRALATGIAVCGSGVGTFVFAPFASWLLSIMEWRSANLVFSALILSCGLFGTLMKPLEVQVEMDDDDDDEEDVERGGGGRSKPLLQRMAEDKRHYLERGSLAGSAYFMVQLPDGTMERRMKMPLNVDPGVHSSFHLDQLVSGGGMTPVPTMALLPTITEAKTTETGSTAGSDASREGSADPEKKKEEASSNNNTEDANPLPNIPEPIEEEKESDEADSPTDSTKDLPVSTSIPIPNKNNIRERRNSEGVQSSSPPSNQTTPVSSVKQDAAAAFLSKSPSKPTMPPRVGSTLGSQFGSKSVAASIPRNGSAPQFNYGRSIPKNTSVPFFDKQQASRKPSFRAVPLGTAPSKGSKANLQETQSRRGSITNTIKGSIASFMGSKIINTTTQDEDCNSLWSKQELSDGLIFSSSKKDTTTEPRHIIRPMSRKDIFYSGSIVNLPEYKSQMSINSYRQSVLNIPRISSGVELDGYGSPEKPKPSVCPCLGQGAGAFKSALAQLMDFSLLANPVFLFIAISNVFGMLGFYVPFVYLIDAAVLKGVDADSAAFLLSIIGVTNTIGRVVSGMVSDLPQVNSLFMNNVCILLSGVCVFVVPFCGSSYYAYVGVAIFFGLFVSAYISLTSIILVDLLGLENLTNAFGLLILFRGAAGIVGAPLAGAVFDNFKSYDVSFYLAGGFLLISAAISFMVPLVTRCAPEKPLLEPPSQPGGFLEDIPEAAESNTNSGDFEESEKYDQVESCL
ncbi:unnamed protein product [Orchesella dallaii]|uniref:Monocarboxylate transporter 12 n=1 Tax=Orchesella dallaii TaxID=48710 RepID=A0ABP1QRK5_9HEXA